jgi:hypothetical protein
MTPSFTPPAATTAAVVAAVSLHDSTGFDAAFISIVPQNDCMSRLVQLTAGAAEAIPL